MYSYKSHFPTEVKSEPKYLLKKKKNQKGGGGVDDTLQFIKLKKKERKRKPLFVQFCKNKNRRETRRLTAPEPSRGRGSARGPTAPALGTGSFLPTVPPT